MHWKFMVLGGMLLLCGAAWAEEPVGHPVVDVLDRTVIEPLETSGYGLHALLGGLLGGRVEVPPTGRVSNAWMREHSGAYAPLAGAWSEHIQAVIDSVERPLVVEHEHAKAFPAGNVGRAFDVRWFSSEKAFFQLVGVVNRLDRRVGPLALQLDQSRCLGAMKHHKRAILLVHRHPTLFRRVR